MSETNLLGWWKKLQGALFPPATPENEKNIGIQSHAPDASIPVFYVETGQTRQVDAGTDCVLDFRNGVTIHVYGQSQELRFMNQGGTPPAALSDVPQVFLNSKGSNSEFHILSPLLNLKVTDHDGNPVAQFSPPLELTARDRHYDASKVAYLLFYDDRTSEERNAQTEQNADRWGWTHACGVDGTICAPISDFGGQIDAWIDPVERA